MIRLVFMKIYNFGQLGKRARVLPARDNRLFFNPAQGLG